MRMHSRSVSRPKEVSNGATSGMEMWCSVRDSIFICLPEASTDQPEHERVCLTCPTTFISAAGILLKYSQLLHNNFLSPAFVFCATRVNSDAFCQFPV